MAEIESFLVSFDLVPIQSKGLNLPINRGDLCQLLHYLHEYDRTLVSLNGAVNVQPELTMDIHYSNPRMGDICINSWTESTFSVTPLKEEQQFIVLRRKQYDPNPSNQRFSNVLPILLNSDTDCLICTFKEGWHTFLSRAFIFCEGNSSDAQFLIDLPTNVAVEIIAEKYKRPSQSGCYELRRTR